jgi:iron complex transport system substrate-binding protein
MRVVSVCCSNTEIVCALGCGEMLVGVDDHSDFPPEVVARLPQLGPELGVDVGRVAALDPDIVLASLTVPGHEKVVAGLEAAGVALLVTEPTSLGDVARDIEEISRALGVPERGARLAADFLTAIRDEESEAGPVRPRILIEWWPKPVIAPGKRSWATEMIAIAGGANPIGDDEVASRPLGVEELCELDPDAIVIAWCGVPPEKYRRDVVLNRPGCADVAAVRTGRVFPIPEAFLGRPGPRLVEGVRALKRVVAACRAEAETPHA